MPERRFGGSSTLQLPTEGRSTPHGGAGNKRSHSPRVHSKKGARSGQPEGDERQGEGTTDAVGKAAPRAKDRPNSSNVLVPGGSARESKQQPQPSNKPTIPASVLQKLSDLYHQRHDDAASFWGIYGMLTQGANLCISPPNLVRALLHAVRERVVVAAATESSPLSDDVSGATAIDSSRAVGVAGSDGAVQNLSTLREGDAVVSDSVIVDLAGPLLVEEFLAVAEFLMTSSEYNETFLEDERTVLQLAVLGERSLLLAPNSGPTSARNALPSRSANSSGLAAGKTPATPRSFAAYHHGASALREVLPAARAAVAPYCHTRVLDAAAEKRGMGSGDAVDGSTTVDMDLDAIWKALSSRGAHYRRRSSLWQTGGDGVAAAYDEASAGTDGGSNAAAGRTGGAAEDPFSAETKRLLQRMASTAQDDFSDSASQTTRGSRGLGAGAGFGALTDYSSPMRGSATKLIHSRLQVRKSFSHSLTFSGSSPQSPLSLQQEPSHDPQSPTSPVDGFDEALDDEGRRAKTAKRHAGSSGSRRQDSVGEGTDGEPSTPDTDPSLANAEALLQQLSLGFFPHETSQVGGAFARGRTGVGVGGAGEDGVDNSEADERSREDDAAVARPPASRRQSVLEQYENRRRTTRLANLSFSFGGGAPLQTLAAVSESTTGAAAVEGGANRRASVSSHNNPDPDIEDEAVRHVPSSRRGLPPTSRRTSTANPPVHFNDLEVVESSFWMEGRDIVGGMYHSVNAVNGVNAVSGRRASLEPPHQDPIGASRSSKDWSTRGDCVGTTGDDGGDRAAGSISWGGAQPARIPSRKECTPFVLSKKERRLMYSKRMTTSALTREVDSLGSDVVAHIPRNALKQILRLHAGLLHQHQQSSSSSGLPPPHPACGLARPATSTSAHTTEGSSLVAMSSSGLASRPSTAPNPITVIMHSHATATSNATATRLQDALHFSHASATTASPQLTSPTSSDLSALRPKCGGASSCVVSGCGEHNHTDDRAASPSSVLRSRPVSTASHASRRTAPIARLTPLTDEESESALRSTPQLRSWMKGGKTW